MVVGGGIPPSRSDGTGSRLDGETTSTKNSIPNIKNIPMAQHLQQPSSRRPRILCLHGKNQSGDVFSLKISGARRKLKRYYELHFLDAPIRQNNDDEQQQPPAATIATMDATAVAEKMTNNVLSWWERDENNNHYLVSEAIEYIRQHIVSLLRQEQQRKEEEGVVTDTKDDDDTIVVTQQPIDHDSINYHYYDAIIGFSQGGTLATALAGILPGIQAVVTAGAPYHEQVFTFAEEFCWNSKNNNDDTSYQDRLSNLPKLHFAGLTDMLVPIESTKRLCDYSGNSQLLIHEQGHTFPTRSKQVNDILDFLHKNIQ